MDQDPSRRTWSADGESAGDEAVAPEPGRRAAGGAGLGVMRARRGEPTRVARRAAAGEVQVQRQAQAEAAAPAEATAGGRPAALLVDDGPVGPGQMLKSTFIEQLRAQVTAAASDELGVLAVVGCPYIDQYFARYGGQPAAAGEAMLRRYAPATAGVADAAAMIPLVVVRVRTGVRQWRETGAAPADLPAGAVPDDAAGGAAPPATDASGAAVQLARASGHVEAEAGSPAAILDTLGAGSELDRGHGGRLGAAMGDDFGDVRIHTDAVAARQADELGARAFAVGSHVAFAAGAYAPGTPEGDALLAHELAHVQQQRGGAIDAAARKRIALDGPDGALEQEADQVAAAAVTQLHQPGSAATVRAKASLTSTLSLKRCGGGKPKPTVAAAPPIPTTHGADQHAGAVEPDAAQQGGIYGHLNPNAVSTTPVTPPVTGGPTPAPTVTVQTWDGNDPDPGRAAANRARATADLQRLMRTYLNGFTAHIARMRLARRIPMTQAGTGTLAGQDTGVQGIANLANNAVNTAFGASMGAAASTSGMTSGRTTALSAVPPTRPGDPRQTLFDGNDPVEHAAALGQSQADMAVGTAWWIATSTNDCEALLRTHHWDPSRGGDEESVFNAALTTFLATGTNQADTIDYEVFGLNAAGDGTVAILTAIDPTAQGGDAAKAEKATRWEVYETAIHETVHLRAHPNFDTAIGSKQVMREGFCEMFTEEAVNPILTRVRGGGDEPLRMGVEGKPDPIDLALIPTAHVVPGQYQNFYDHAIAVRDGGGGSTAVGANACRAAFFQGHVELIGLKPDGTQATAPPAGARRLAVPAGVHNVDELATASGVARATLVTDNPGIDAALPAAAVMAGCREHLVVEATDTSGTAVEGRSQIAAQNGVSEADLVRANPGITVDAATNRWRALTAGERLLIPQH